MQALTATRQLLIEQSASKYQLPMSSIVGEDTVGNDNTNGLYCNWESNLGPFNLEPGPSKWHGNRT